MKKYLIILLCALGLGGCNPFYFYHACCVDDSHYDLSIYFLPSKHKKEDTIEKKFALSEAEFSEYLENERKNGKNIKEFLLDNGADCISYKLCYFYFFPIFYFETENKHLFKISTLMAKAVYFDKNIKSYLIEGYIPDDYLKNDIDLIFDVKKFSQIRLLSYKASVKSEELKYIEPKQRYKNTVNFLKGNDYANK